MKKLAKLLVKRLVDGKSKVKKVWNPNIVNFSFFTLNQFPCTYETNQLEISPKTKDQLSQNIFFTHWLINNIMLWFINAITIVHSPNMSTFTINGIYKKQNSKLHLINIRIMHFNNVNKKRNHIKKQPLFRVSIKTKPCTLWLYAPASLDRSLLSINATKQPTHRQHTTTWPQLNYILWV